jgi:hypothetical protein
MVALNSIELLKLQDRKNRKRILQMPLKIVPIDSEHPKTPS